MNWKLRDLFEHCNATMVLINGSWVPARPVPCCFKCRMRAAWLVLIGGADAVIWPQDEDDKA